MGHGLMNREHGDDVGAMAISLENRASTVVNMASSKKSSPARAETALEATNRLGTCTG